MRRQDDIVMDDVRGQMRDAKITTLASSDRGQTTVRSAAPREWVGPMNSEAWGRFARYSSPFPQGSMIDFSQSRPRTTITIGHEPRSNEQDHLSRPTLSWRQS